MTIDPHEDDFEYTENDSAVFRSKLKRFRIHKLIENYLDRSGYLRDWRDFCLFRGEPTGEENWNRTRDQFWQYQAHRNDPYSEWFDPSK
jgi:hypothetical protein